MCVCVHMYVFVYFTVHYICHTITPLCTRYTGTYENTVHAYNTPISHTTVLVIHVNLQCLLGQGLCVLVLAATSTPVQIPVRT